MTNDERKKMNAEFTRLPRCLETDIPMFVAFSFSTGYKRFSSALERKPYPHFYGCPHCFRRKKQAILGTFERLFYFAIHLPFVFGD